MKILVANIGSTSLKYRLFDFSNGQEALLTKGGFERLTEHGSAIEAMLADLKRGLFLRDESELAAVGFKTVIAKGVNGCTLLDEKAMTAMEAFIDIAPAHNGPYVQGVRQFAKKMPKTPLVGLFETAFYQWVPEESVRYGVPFVWHQLGVRRWGFHGSSHKFVAERSAELLGRTDVAERARKLYVDGGISPVKGAPFRVISCHLGGSSSVTGILNGVAIGNSMGMTPQSGVIHNNRVGELDSMAIPYVMKQLGISAEEAVRQLCKEGGIKGLSGGLTDVRDLTEGMSNGNASAKLAFDAMAKNVRHWIGSYYLELNGLDALVFTAGIGENQGNMRTAVCANLDQLGIQLDETLNAQVKAKEAVISSSSSKVQVMVIPTNEELVVAREVKRLIETKK